MSLTPKQKKILEFASSHEKQITKKQAFELIGGCYYCNASKHVGDVLSRMVNSGLLKRLKNGHFEISEKKTETVKNIINPNQLELL
jgi:predicted transcriptional regulator of viral defense system